MNLTSKALKTISQYNLFKTGDKVIVAVSGGGDSIALLHTLNCLRYRFGLRLYVAHLNHGLRRSADIDQRFVKNIAQQLKLPFVTAKVNVSKNKKKGSIEELARNARIDFLSKTAKRYNVNVIALGHTQDDLAETVLMRLLRGAGLSGLRGILPKRKIGDFLFVRPLFDITRNEIRQYLKKAKIRFRNDPTNNNTKIFRNKIRLKLIPLMEKNYNRNIKETLSNLANSASIDYGFLEHCGTRALKKIAKMQNKKQRLHINLRDFLKINPALQRMTMRLAIQKLKGNTRRLTFMHMKEIEDLVYNRRVRSVVNLPNQIIVSKSKDCLIVSLRKV